MDTDRLQQMEQQLHAQRLQQDADYDEYGENEAAERGSSGGEEDGEDEGDYEPVGRPRHWDEGQPMPEMANGHSNTKPMDLSHQFGNCDLSEI